MSGQASICIKHNFETAHRLPFLKGKCESIHGHSWWVRVNIINYKHDEGVDSNGISVEYGQVKALIRSWIDEFLDHGTMLGSSDNLLHAFIEDGSKVFIFGDVPENSVNISNYWPGKPWPTVEAVAEMLATVLQELLDTAFDNSLWVDSVQVHETFVNSALWVPSLKREGNHAAE